MDKKILFQNLAKLTKQRDLFLLLSLVSLLSNICLTVKIIMSDEKIIMVPSIGQDMWLSNKSVSPSYIEETALFFLSNLLDINASDISHKKAIIMKYIVSNNRYSINAIQEYFSNAEEKYKKFDIATYFTVKEIEIDAPNLRVLAHGLLTSSYGKKGSSTKDETYVLQFEYSARKLMLKSFERIIEQNK